MSRQTDLAWAAGIIDGEGCITITRQQAGKSGRVNLSHRLYLKVTMGHRATVERLRDIFGAGSISIQRSPRYNDAHSWFVSTRQAGDVLVAVRPYLVAKAIEADLAFEFLRLPKPRQGGTLLTPEIVAERERLFVALRDAKPSARFRSQRTLTTTVL